MFTGIVKIGKVKEKVGNKLKISCDFTPNVSESIAINGVCLTVTNAKNNEFEVYLSPHTLEKTNLKNIKPMAEVNLERALTLQDRLGGHIVQGHVDEVGKVIRKRRLKDAIVLTISTSLTKYLVKNCSIAIDGVSLTVADVKNNSFDVVIIPFTQKNTTLGKLRVGDKVNIEIDIISKYLRNKGVK